MVKPKCSWQCPEDWSEWSQWLAAGLHARNRWRLPILLVGILFAHGRRTVTTWLRAAEKAATGAAARSWPSAEVWQEPHQSGQASRPPRRLASCPVHRLQPHGHQALQDLPGKLPAGRRGDSRRDRAGRRRLASFLFDRSRGHGRRDHRSLRRPCHDRAGLPRHQGSLGSGPATSTKHLDQPGGLPSQPLDPHLGGTLVLGSFPPRIVRSKPLAVGRCPASSVPRRSTQGVAATHHGTRIIDACRPSAAATQNTPTHPTPDGVGQLT